MVSDIAQAEERERQAARVATEMPQLDLLINNAGVQRRIALAEDHAAWPERQAELDTLLSGPVQLNSLLIPVILGHRQPATIVNVSSGGALVPQPLAPIYSAAKAAIHSYTTTLRHACGRHRHRRPRAHPASCRHRASGSAGPHGADVDEFCSVAFAAIEAHQTTMGFGPTDTVAVRQRLRAEQQTFDVSSSRFPVPRY